jgi:hypothetical protein
VPSDDLVTHVASRTFTAQHATNALTSELNDVKNELNHELSKLGEMAVTALIT